MDAVTKPSEVELALLRQSFAWTQWEVKALTPTQIAVASAKMAGSGYREIQARFGLTGQGRVATILERTFLGLSSDVTGRRSVLSDVDRCRLFETLQERAGAYKNCRTYEVIMEIEALLAERVRRSHVLAWLCRCDKIAAELPIAYGLPDSKWLHQFCLSCGLNIQTPQTIEVARLEACTSATVTDFYKRNQEFLSRDYRCMFNMDETSAFCTKNLKVVVPEGYQPFAECLGMDTHVTVAFCFSASGWYPKPFMIFEDLRTYPVGVGFYGDAIVCASQRSGWMTRWLFFHWAVHFVHELSHYRLTLPPQLRNARVTLLVDGHTSRYNSKACSYLYDHGVDLVMIPPHTSHAIQPFDIGIAAPFKCRTKQRIVSPNPTTQARCKVLTTQAAKLRCQLVAAILEAWRMTANVENCMHAFNVGGLCPFSLQKVTENRWVRPVGPNEPAYQLTGRFTLSGQAIGINEVRLISTEVEHRPFAPPTRQDIENRSSIMENGVVFTAPMSLVTLRGSQADITDFA